MPSRKWFTARIAALTGLATMWATTGSWDLEETLMAITLVSAAALAYRVKNDNEGGGE